MESTETVKPVHVPPTMGGTVDAVMRAFIKESDDWCGIKVVEALLVLTDKGPARKYRVLGPGAPRRGTRIGVAEVDGLCLRDSTAAEEAELEEGIAKGWVQIYSMRRGFQRSVMPDGAAQQVVLHQATGREMPRG